MRQIKRRAFSLLEVLAAIAVLGLLVAVAVPIFEKIRAGGDRTAAVANMRTIGQGISLYAADHGGMLPGPLWPGQMPQLDPGREGRLVRELASHLDIAVPSTPQVVALFVPPAYRRAVGNVALSNARTFVLNMNTGTAAEPFQPWGSLTSQPPLPPRRMAQVPAAAWGFSDADRLHPRVGAAAWKAQTPAWKIHGPRRLAWFFNGSVGPVEEAELEMPR